MKAREVDLRRALDEEALSQSRPERGCPGVEALARIVEADATAAERTSFAEHAAVCPDCAEEYRAALSARAFAVDAARLLTGSKLPEAEPPAARRRSLAWMAVAASLLVAAGLSFALLNRWGREPEPAAERGAASAPSAVEPPDGAALAGPPARLAWAAVDGAESYRAVLYDAESTPIWESGALREPEARLPEEARGRLRGGGDFYWRVETRRKAERLSSPLHKFSLRASSAIGG